MPRLISQLDYNRQALRRGRRSLLLTPFLLAVLVSGLFSIAYAADLCRGEGYDVGMYPYSMAAADFNGDSKPDLVTANSELDNVSVLLNDGAGRFGAAKPFGVGDRPAGLVVADFNGDSKPDIVTANNASFDLSVLLGDGSGGFGVATNYPLGWPPDSVAVGDFNNDGKLDLAVASTYAVRITILAGDGAGHFSTLNNINHVSAYYLAVGDFNHDGKADLVVGHSGFYFISILLGDGAGGFGAPTEIQTGARPEYVAIGDLNGDGNSDLAVSVNDTPSQVAVLLGNGAGGFTSPTKYAAGNYPRSISIGDFDNDGKADLGVANYYSGTVSVLPGNGVGGFGTAMNYVMSSPTSTVGGDFNSDGRTDLAVAYNDVNFSKVSVLFNSCNAVPGPGPTPTPATTYSISGKVINGGVFTSVRLSGTQGGISGLDGNGNYSFPNLPAGGTYTVTPQSSNNVYQYTFSPPSKTFTNLSANETFDFTQNIVTNSVSGKVTDVNGVALAGIDVVVNMGSWVTKTDANGNYSFPNLPSGQSYSVGAVSPNYMFTPVRHEITNLSANVIINFTGNPLYNITGRITDINGAGVGGIFVSVNGPLMSRSTTTDSQGNYLINSLPAGGDYVMNVSGQYAFDPPGRIFNNLSGHQTANFVAFPAVKIEGRVVGPDGLGIGGVTVTVSGTYPSGTPITAITNTFSQGSYFSPSVAAGGNYTVTPSKTGYTFLPVNRTYNNMIADQVGDFIGFATFLQLSSSSYTVGEANGSAQLVVIRTDATGAAKVDYATSDSAGLAACNQVNTGIASSRCDYATTTGTLRFAAGEVSKTIYIPLVDDAYTEGSESLTLTLSNPSGATLGSTATATVAITDNDSGSVANPIDQVPFFARQQYIDFLGREPDAAGWQGWQNILNNCGVTIAPPCDRIEVSAGFFRSEEFQSRGYFIYKFYSAVGRIPTYNQFMPDFAKVSGFLSPQQLEDNKIAFVQEFMERQDYQSKYGLINGQENYVNALLNTVGLPNHPLRATWVAGLTNNTLTRAQVFRALTESGEVYQKYYNEAFVIMQYFGYLRRDADISYLQWIQTMNQTGGDYRIMINGFLNSLEYRQRFGN